MMLSYARSIWTGGEQVQVSLLQEFQTLHLLFYQTLHLHCTFLISLLMLFTFLCCSRCLLSFVVLSLSLSLSFTLSLSLIPTHSFHGCRIDLPVCFFAQLAMSDGDFIEGGGGGHSQDLNVTMVKMV